jgi:hypothetical protein
MVLTYDEEMKRNKNATTLTKGLLGVLALAILFGTCLYIKNSSDSGDNRSSDKSIKIQTNTNELQNEEADKATKPATEQESNSSADSSISSIKLSQSESTLLWISSPVAPQKGYILYWSRVGCLSKFGCVADESELKVKGYKEILGSTTSSYSLGDNESSVMAMVCENVSGSCGIESNIVRNY